MLSLNESYNNLAVIVNAALMNKQERMAVDESLNNIARALQAFERSKEIAKAVPAVIEEKKAKTEDGVKKAAVAHCKRD